MLEETFQKSHVSSSGVLKLTSFSQTRAMTRRRSVRLRVFARSNQGSRRVRRRTNSPPQPHVRTSSSDPPTMQANCLHGWDFGAISRWINVSLRVRSSRAAQVTSQPRAVHARPRVRQPFVDDAAIGGAIGSARPVDARRLRQHGAESPLAAREGADRCVEVVDREVGPQDLGDVQFRVGNLPEEVV